MYRKTMCLKCDCVECVSRKMLLENAQIKEEGNKRCKKCHEIKPLEQFDYAYRKNSTTRRGECKLCLKIINAEYYKKRKEAKKIVSK